MGRESACSGEEADMSVRNRVRCALGAAVVVLGASIPAVAFASSGSSGSGSSGSGAQTSPKTPGGGSISGIKIPTKVPSPGNSKTSRPQCTTTSGLPAAKAFVELQLQKRVTELGILQARVASSSRLTAPDRSNLQTDIAGDLSAMKTLEGKLSGEKTCAGLVTDARSMVFGYRIYLVMAPKTDLVIVSDTETAVASQIQGAESRIDSDLNLAGKAGKNVAHAEQAFGSLETEITAAQKAVSGVSATVMAQTPAGSPGNRSVFVRARASCETAYTDLHA